jgi:hypothetical protein
MKKLISKIGILAVIVFALTACYPGGAEYTSDTDIVITDYDEQYNFSAVKTYFLSDSIQHINDDGESPNYSMDDYILSTLASQFDALGWERIIDSTAAEPDVAVVVAAIEVENYNYYTMPWYPGWGYGWYWKSTGETNYWGYPGYGWGYPPYYGGAYVSSYSTGTVAWNLFDPRLVDEESETVVIQWVGAINGVLGTSTSTTESRISTAINQAFYQSPYLSE